VVSRRKPRGALTRRWRSFGRTSQDQRNAAAPRVAEMDDWREASVFSKSPPRLLQAGPARWCRRKKKERRRGKPPVHGAGAYVWIARGKSRRSGARDGASSGFAGLPAREREQAQGHQAGTSDTPRRAGKRGARSTPAAFGPPARVLRPAEGQGEQPASRHVSRATPKKAQALPLEMAKGGLNPCPASQSRSERNEGAQAGRDRKIKGAPRGYEDGEA